jgi:hypothetical protein
MRKLIVSINSTLNGVVTGPAEDPPNFMTWAQAPIKNSLEDFVKDFGGRKAMPLAWNKNVKLFRVESKS